MLKIIGMLLIFLSASGTGFTLSFSIYEKRQRLILIKKLINEFIADLSFKKTPVLSLIERLKNDSDFEKLQFLKSFSKDNFSGENDNYKNLSKEERVLIKEFFKIIGNSATDTQINLLKDLKSRTEDMINKASEESRERGKLFSMGGILTGIFIVILVI